MKQQCDSDRDLVMYAEWVNDMEEDQEWEYSNILEKNIL
jgi:hypothetical protein